MAIQNVAGYGVRTLTPEERARLQAQQQAYQVTAAERAAADASDFARTQQIGLANQGLAPMIPPALPSAPAPAQRPAPVAAAPAIPPAAPAAPAAPAPATTLSPEILADVNNRIAQTLAAAKPEAGILQPTERGNYNQYNTDVANLAQPVGAGLNFGFGVNGAPTAQQYLAQMARQDTANAQARQQAAVDRELAYATAQLTPNASIGQIAAARGRIAALQPLALATAENQGRLGVAQIGADASAATDLARLQAAQLGAEADVTGRLLAADLTGRYGVQAAQAKGQADINAQTMKNMSPEARKAAAEAAIAEAQLAAVQSGVETGELNSASGVIAALRSGQERQPQVYIDPITGAPLSDAEVRLIQRRRLLEEQQRQQPQ